MEFKQLSFETIEENKKKLNYKHIIAIVVAVLILIVSIYLCIKVGINSKAEEPKQEENVQENIIEEEPVTQNVIPLPILTENAKIEIDNIYKSEIKRVFLTFDDGPSTTVTPQILDILKANNIKATFFVLGSCADLYPDIVKRAYDEGHFIANHGYSHKYQSIYASPNNVLDEYIRTENSIKNAIGNQEYASHLFRFPGGSVGGKYSTVKKQAINILTENQIAYVDWNCLTKDSEGNFGVGELLSNLYNTSQNKNSIVVLMHDAGAKQSTADALQGVIDYFREKGYEFMNFYDIMK